jgi:hypothetical protein
MSAEQALNLVSFLDKVAGLYPSGIPKALLRAPVKQDSARRDKVIFFVVEESGHLSDEDRAFLASIAAKGLQLSEDLYRIQLVRTEIEGREFLAQTAEADRPGVSIFFEARTQESTLGTDYGVAIIQAASLAEIARNAQHKRAFWKLLQEILPRLRS